MNLFELSIEIILMKLSKHTERILFHSYKKRKFFSSDCDYLDSTEN